VITKIIAMPVNSRKPADAEALKKNGSARLAKGLD